MVNWKRLDGIVDDYAVSDCGEVMRLSTGEIIKQSNPNQYPSVSLKNKYGTLNCTVHRLVAVAFLPNPENKPAVNHIDGNKKNNHVSNLEWVTTRENNLHMHRVILGRNPKRKARPKAEMYGTKHERTVLVLGINQSDGSRLVIAGAKQRKDLGMHDSCFYKKMRAGKPYKGYMFYRMPTNCNQALEAK